MTIIKKSDTKTVEQSWGKLTWYLSAQEDRIAKITFGKCEILPGHCNDLHYHPNCQEVLHLKKGVIIHTYNGESEVLETGDTILIPAGVEHNAKNISDETAEMIISFSNGDRQTVLVQ